MAAKLELQNVIITTSTVSEKGPQANDAMYCGSVNIMQSCTFKRQQMDALVKVVQAPLFLSFSKYVFLFQFVNAERVNCKDRNR